MQHRPRRVNPADWSVLRDCSIFMHMCAPINICRYPRVDTPLLYTLYPRLCYTCQNIPSECAPPTPTPPVRLARSAPRATRPRSPRVPATSPKSRSPARLTLTLPCTKPTIRVRSLLQGHSRWTRLTSAVSQVGSVSAFSLRSMQHTDREGRLISMCPYKALA